MDSQPSFTGERFPSAPHPETFHLPASSGFFLAHPMLSAGSPSRSSVVTNKMLPCDLARGRQSVNSGNGEAERTHPRSPWVLSGSLAREDLDPFVPPPPRDRNHPAPPCPCSPAFSQGPLAQLLALMRGIGSAGLPIRFPVLDILPGLR